MATKFLETFKKFPNQIPLFKKGSEKCHADVFSHHNAIFGMPDDASCLCTDDQLKLLAVGTEKGIIKICGFPGMNTLCGRSNKPIKSMIFIQGQGRLVALNSSSELVVWEFNVATNKWEIMCSKTILNHEVTHISISSTFSWKSLNDETLQCLIIGCSTGHVKIGLITGNVINIYEENDFGIDHSCILEKCSLEKDYEFGKISHMEFNKKNQNFYLAFENGLVTMFNIQISKVESKEVQGTEKEVLETETQKENNPEVTNEVINDKDGEDKKEETEKDSKENETETDTKVSDANKNNKESEEKDETVKVEETTKVDTDKNSIELNCVVIERPIFLSKMNSEKFFSICWKNESDILIQSNLGDITSYTLDESNESVSKHKFNVSDKQLTLAFNLQHYQLNDDSIVTFINEEDEIQKLVIVKNDKIIKEYCAKSTVLDYNFITSNSAEDAELFLIILCKSELVIFHFDNDNIAKVEYPIFQFNSTSTITTVSEIIQVKASLFPANKSIHDVMNQIKLKTPLIETDEKNTNIDIFISGHSNGDIKIWQILSSGILIELTSLNSKEIYENCNEVEENLFSITTLKLIYEDDEESLYLVVGNTTGLTMSFKFDESEIEKEVILINSTICGLSESDGVTCEDENLLKLKDTSNLNIKNLNYLIQLEPSMPVSSLFYQIRWNMLIVGCNYGFSLVDLKNKNSVFTYPTLSRTVKNDNGVVTPLTMGQQLKKSVRQSFRKLRKLRPANKHAYTVNDDAKGDSEAKKTEDSDSKKKEDTNEKSEVEPATTDKETHQTAEDTNKETKKEEGEETKKDEMEVTKRDESEEPKKEESKDIESVNAEEIPKNDTEDAVHEPELLPVSISKKEKPNCIVKSILMVTTNLKTLAKEPSLFVGTNSGAIYAFEINFDMNDESIHVKLSKELHLQHKAPVIDLIIKDSNNIPLLTSKQQIGSYNRKYKDVELEKDDNNSTEPLQTDEVGPSGDAENIEKESKMRSETLPPQAETEINRKSIDISNEKTVPASNLKKSGTLPSSFLQAIGKAGSASETHELLVVSEEQVKLFSLPSLKAKNKHKVVDTGHHFSHLRSNTDDSHPVTQDKKSDGAPTTTSEVVQKKPNRNILSIGISKPSKTDKWVVVVALVNGEMLVLSLSNLRKLYSNIYNNGSENINASVTNGDQCLILSQTHNIQITDFSNYGINLYEPLMHLKIPCWSRPVEKVEVQEEDKTKPADVEKTNGEASEEHNGDEPRDLPTNENILPSNSVHQGDVTMDSIKEYITNMDGNVTVKTFESSTEKHIKVDDGKIETTIHEKQIDDGQVVKDDVVKITSDTAIANES